MDGVADGLLAFGGFEDSSTSEFGDRTWSVFADGDGLECFAFFEVVIDSFEEVAGVDLATVEV